MFVKLSVFVCFLLIQGFSAQCVGAYTGLAAEGWPASNALACEGAAEYGNAAPCGGSTFPTRSPYAAGPWAAAFFAITGWGAVYSPASFSASNSGGLAINSASPIAPNGVSMNSKNIYEGPLAVSGAVPFLGVVALEGALPTGVAGVVAYGCGNGNVAMLNEDYNSGYVIGALGYETSKAGPVYGYNDFAGPVTMEAGVAGQAYGYNRIVGTRARGCGAVL